VREVGHMSGQENVEDKALEASGSSEAHGGRSFSEAYGHFWLVPLSFMSKVWHDKRIGLPIRAGIAYHLGAIAGINEMLLDASSFSQAEGCLNKPENVKQYTEIMSKLKALYEDYINREKVYAIDLAEDIEGILVDLLEFARGVMRNSKYEGC